MPLSLIVRRLRTSCAMRQTSVRKPMLTKPTDFISRFLYHLRDDEWYGNPGAPPTPEILAQVAATAKDTLGFEAHRGHFTALAKIIDTGVAEELAVRGSGIAARNASKHPLVAALGKSDFQDRAGISAAAAQGLVWMEECRQWVQDVTLRNQIAKRVMTAIVVSVGRIKRGYSPAQLAALVRIGASLKDNDVFVVRTRGAIAEILAGSFSSIPRDEGTLLVMRQFLDRVADCSNAVPVFKAMDKLLSLTSDDHAARLRQAILKYR